MKKYLLAAIFLVFLALPSVVLGHGKFININLVGGGAVPMGGELQKEDITRGCNAETDPCNPAFFGAGGGAGLDIQFPYHLGLELLFTFHSFLRKETELPPPQTNLTGLTPFNSLTGFIGLNFRVLDVIPSYHRKWGTLIVGVGAGGGALYNEPHVAIRAALGYLYPVYNRDNLTFQVGVGCDFVWQHPFAGGLENDMYLAFGLRMSLGILKGPWAKGKKKLGEGEEEMGIGVSEEMKRQDTDGDGLNDYCELMLGTNQKAKDSDGDGLFDSEEDRNQNCQRDDGETDPVVADTDGGGSQDGWEVRNGYDPMNPDDDDKDQDFVTDSNDSCLNTPRGIAVNERGCPVIIELTILEGVKFLPGSAEFAPGAQEALDMWVAVLAENPELKFQIVGYTDSKGNRRQLISLSKKRAQAVLDYFSSKGISEARMTAVGKGPADPIASNKTEEGRAANNRIAIVPVKEK